MYVHCTKMQCPLVHETRSYSADVAIARTPSYVALPIMVNQIIFIIGGWTCKKLTSYETTRMNEDTPRDSSQL